MTLEWDNAKRRLNEAKHGIDFAEADAFEWDSALIAQDKRHTETRFIATGFIGSRLHVLVWTPRGSAMRIISLRKANRREVRRYAQQGSP